MSRTSRTHSAQSIFVRRLFCTALAREYYAAGGQRLKERKEIHGAISLVMVVVAPRRAWFGSGRLVDMPQQLARHLVHALGRAIRVVGPAVDRQHILHLFRQTEHFAREE